MAAAIVVHKFGPRLYIKRRHDVLPQRQAHGKRVLLASTCNVLPLERRHRRRSFSVVVVKLEADQHI